jgi:hypothetical protein
LFNGILFLIYTNIDFKLLKAFSGNLQKYSLNLVTSVNYRKSNLFVSLNLVFNCIRILSIIS